MKKISYFIFPLLGFLIVHLAVSYYYVDLNPVNWEEGGRFFAAFFGFVLLLAGIGIAYAMNDND